MMVLTYGRRTAAVLGAIFGLGCGGGNDGPGGTQPPPPPAPTYTVGGPVSGLTGSGLILQNNSANDLAVAQGATSYTFPGSFSAGSPYAITVKTQPTGPSQSCAVANGSGQISNANVQAPVTCTVNSFAVGGTITGLFGNGLALQLNGGSPLQVAAGTGGFSFPPIASGTAYTVSVSAQPTGPAQTCTVANGTGTVGNANVGNVVVTCVSLSYTIGGAIAGLSGTGLVLQNNGKNDLTIPAGATQFTFAGSVPPGTAYSVSALAQPSSPAQTCSVANATGNANANVTNVVVNCVSNTATVGGSVSGLSGSGLSLLLNGAAPLAVASGATSFTFPGPLAPGSSYTVAIGAHPAGQTCTLANATGTTPPSGNVTTVAVTCTTNAPNSWTVGGTITGLSQAGLVLKLNGTTLLAVPAGATTFTFPALPAGSPYAVNIGTTAANQVCNVTANGAGTVGSANVTNVAVTCILAAYLVKGTINGLVGTGLSLLMNGGSRINPAPGTTSFTFAGHVSYGATYTVVLAAQPSNPVQTCTLVNGTGTMGSADVTDVVINCTTTYSVSGIFDPGFILWSNGGVLLLNGGSPQNMLVDRPNFTFPGLPSGMPYSVTVGTKPSAPPTTCNVLNGNGTIGAANVTNVVLQCLPDGIIILGTLAGYTGGGITLKIEANRGSSALPTVPPITPQSQGKYAFPDLYQPNDEYRIFIGTQPSGQSCTIRNAIGKVVGNNGPFLSSAQLKCLNNTTSPLSGVYSVLIGNRRSYLAFWPNGTFTLASRSDDTACPDNGNGVEYGVYNYNAGSGALALLEVTIDTNGGCGLATPGTLPPPITVTQAGATLTLNTTEGPVALTKVTSTPNTLVGAWAWSAGFDGAFVVLQPDNTYIIVQPQGSGNHGLLIRPGYERACYVASSSTITGDLSAACKPDGAAVVDNNGETGLSSAGGPVSFTITGPNTVTIGDVTLIRMP